MGRDYEGVGAASGSRGGGESARVGDQGSAVRPQGGEKAEWAPNAAVFSPTMNFVVAEYKTGYDVKRPNNRTKKNSELRACELIYAK